MTEQTARKVPQIRFRGFEGEWNNTTLQTACSLLTGHPFQSKQFTKSGFFLVRGMNVKRGYIDDSEQISKFWPSSSGLEVFLLKKDDIVIQMDGALIGRSYAKVRQENLPALLVQRVTRGRCASTPNSDYIYQYIERDFLKYIRATKTETAVPHLSLDDIRQFPISISTPAEQTQIGEYFRELDSLIGLHQRKHDKLVTLKKAMLQKMFPQPGTTTPEIRFKSFSGEWVENEFKLIAARSTQTAVDEHLPRIEYEDITSGTGRLNKDLFKKSSRKVGINFDEGDVLFGKLRPYLKNWWLAEYGGIAVGDFWVFKSAAATSNFIYCLIQTEDFERIANQSAGSKMPRSDWKLVSNSVFRIPIHVEEQQKIGTYFRTLDALISQHATQLQKLQQIKSACLEKMFV